MDLVAINVLFLEQELDANIKGFYLYDHIEISNALEINLKPQQVHSHLYFNHSVILVKDVNRTVTQSITLVESQFPSVINQSVEHIIVFHQQLFYGPLFPLVEDALEIVEDVEVFACKAGYDTFEPVDEALCQLYAAPQLAHTLTMSSTATCYKPNKCWVNGDFTVEAP